MSPKMDEEKKLMEKIPYSNSVGSIMHSMIISIPYVYFVISALSIFIGNPGKNSLDGYKVASQIPNRFYQFCFNL